MNVFDLAAKITLDDKEYNSKLDGAFGKLQSVGSKIGSGLATAAKVGAAAVGAAATAVGALAVKSVSAYSEYEQMVGGVNKLYGNMGMSLEDYAKSQGKTTDEVKTQWETLGKAQDMVLQNAQNAYKTAGMSANQYMATATSFSAALINSLNGDTVKAAEATDVAMTAIADNWNTFGGDIGMIQGAFQGFAKQNYTMLDNLKLGYGGTKKEMQRLIADANEYAKSIGEAGNLSIESFADIVTAIDLVQQKQQIAGTTAREASTTIQGSLGMVKAAWENLMIGMSDGNANLDQMMNNLVDSIAGYTDKTGQHVNGLIDNILPVAEKALASVSTMIEKLAPKIAEELPKLVNTVLPSLLTAGAQIISSLATALVDNLPTLLFTAGDLIQTLLESLVQATEGGHSTLMEIINIIVGVFEENYMQFIDLGIQIIGNVIEGIVNGMPELIGYATEIVGKLVDSLIENLPAMMKFVTQMFVDIVNWISENLDSLVDSAVAIIQTIGQGIVDNLPQIIDAVVQLITTIGETLTDPTYLQMLLETGIAILETLATSLINNLPKLVESAIEIISNLVEFILDNIDKVIDAAIEIILALADGLIKALPKLIEKIPVIIEKLIDAIIRNAPKLVVAAGELIAKLVVGIIQALPKLIEAGMQIVNSIQTGIARLFFKLLEAGKQAVDKIREGIHSINPIEWGKDMIDSFIKGIKDRISKVKEAASDIASAVKDVLGFSEPEEGPLSNFHTFAPDMMNLFIKGVKDNTQKLQDQIEKSFDFGDAIIEANADATKGRTGAYNNSISIPITIYGAEGQNVKELADYVSERILHEINRTGAVYA